MSTSEPRPPRRRWFQYRVRTLLLVTAIVALWLGIYVNRVQRQRAAVQMIHAAGGQVTYEGEANGLLATPPGPKQSGWMTRILGKDFFCDVIAVTFEGVPAKDRDLACLKDLPHLEQLFLFDTEIGGRWFGAGARAQAVEGRLLVRRTRKPHYGSRNSAPWVAAAS